MTAARNQLNSVKIVSGFGEKNDGSGGSGGDSLDKDATGNERKARAVHGKWVAVKYSWRWEV